MESKNSSTQSGVGNVIVARVAVAIVCLAAFAFAVYASSPSSGAITPTTTSPVTWAGNATGTGAAQDESSCVEGVNCDAYTLTVGGTQSSWSKNVINLAINWTIPANDYDLFVHKGDLTGPVVASSANGAPETGQSVLLDPYSMGVGTYTVHVCYWLTTPGVDQYVGTASVAARGSGRIGYYHVVKSGFSPNTPCAAPATDSDGEPSLRCDKEGHCYAVGIRGVPAGVDLWYFDLNPNSPTYDPYMRNPQYRGQPDAFSPTQAVEVGADGGGDVDIVVGQGDSSPNGVPTVALSSLTAANVSTSISYDLGNSWTKNPAGSAPGVPVDDRQWEAFYGTSTVYLYYRTLEPAVSQIQCSTDGGLTFGPAITAGLLGQAGSIDVDQNDGTVYASGSSGEVAIGHPSPSVGYPTSYSVVQAASDPNGVAALFFIVKAAPDGNVYGAYSNGQHVFLISSTDHGQTWSKPVQVDYGSQMKTSLFPALAVSPTTGSVAVGWYGSPDPQNDDNANWQVYVVQTWDALADNPTFTIQQASDHYIHGSNISLGGTLGNANRNLLDYFQIAYDPEGSIVVAYTDDHNDFTGNVYVTRLVSGLNSAGKALPKPREGSQLPARQPYSTDGSQVVAYPDDVTEGLLVSVPLPGPLDIRSIRYTSANTTGGILISAAMKVSQLSSIPPETTWRMDMSADCPFSGLSPSRLFSTGISDRGYQFWVAASTDETGTPSYSYGTAVRNSDGSITYNSIGTADSGSFDPTTDTITVTVAAAKLNALLPAGASPIGPGSVLDGLRGAAFTSVSGVVQEDQTRGGIEFTIPKA